MRFEFKKSFRHKFINGFEVYILPSFTIGYFRKSRWYIIIRWIFFSVEIYSKYKSRYDSNN